MRRAGAAHTGSSRADPPRAVILCCEKMALIIPVEGQFPCRSLTRRSIRPNLTAGAEKICVRCFTVLGLIAPLVRHLSRRRVYPGRTVRKSGVPSSGRRSFPGARAEWATFICLEIVPAGGALGICEGGLRTWIACTNGQIEDSDHLSKMAYFRVWVVVSGCSKGRNMSRPVSLWCPISVTGGGAPC